MESVKALIDKASKVCGGDASLARKLKVSRTLVSLMRSGNRQITPEIAAQLADIAGEDGAQAALNAMVERAKGTPMERVLREILGKAVAVGVAGMLAISYSGDSKTAMEKIASDDTNAEQPIHRIKWALIRAWWFIKRCLGDSATPTGLGPYGLSQPQREKPPLTVLSARRVSDCFVRTSGR